MSNLLLALVACVYAYVSYDYYARGQPGMSLAFAAYALSNLGFIWDLQGRN